MESKNIKPLQKSEKADSSRISTKGREKETPRRSSDFTP